MCLFAATSLSSSALLHAEQAPREEGVLIVAFGTSSPNGKISYESAEKTFHSRFGTDRTSWAYTSDIIRRKLAAKGCPIPSIQQGMKELSSRGIKVLRVQSLHIAAGEEFSQMERTVQRFVEHHPMAFDKVLIGRPLLESQRDMQEVIHTLLSEFPKERTPDQAILFMAHGQKEGRADLVFTAAQSSLRKQDANAFLATVEGTHGFSNVLSELKEKQKNGLKTVWLAPFLIVAGDHAENDLAGDDEDSWASVLKKEGFEVKTNLRGMGEIKAIQEIFLRHAVETKDDIMNIKKGKE